MTRQSLYFARAPIGGVGPMHFLIVPRAAPEGSAARTLLGSLVDEIDAGLFGTREIPDTEHVWTPGYVLDSIARAPVLGDKKLVQQDDLAGISQTLVVNRKFNLGLDVPFPGAPATASLGLDYRKVRRVDVTLGAGARKLYIPTGYLKAGFDHAQQNSPSFDWRLFHDDYMAVRQTLLVRNMTLAVTSESEFGADFEAKATLATNKSLGVSFKRESKKSWSVTLAGEHDHLFAIGAVQLDKLRD